MENFVGMVWMIPTLVGNVDWSLGQDHQEIPSNRFSDIIYFLLKR